MRAGDVLARFGGDEFVILLGGATPAKAARVGEKILAAVRATPLPSAARGLQISASVGIAIIDERSAAGSLTEMLAGADRAMYTAKAGGRDRVSVAAHPGGEGDRS